MKRVVLKFGGAAVASPENILRIADLIERRSREVDEIVVVVSAMANATDQLLELAQKIHPFPPKREQDMLTSVGERISMSLLAMALDLKGKEAISLTGSQAGVITTSQHAEAKIIEIRPKRILQGLKQQKIVIVAGFQGVSHEGEVTTLGRGGSDTTAVALAVALQADKVEFYKDVPGIFNEDPKKNREASLFSHLTYSEALLIIQEGAKVLHQRCVLLAEKNQMPLQVLSFIHPDLAKGSWIGKASSSEKSFSPIYESASEEDLIEMALT
ncbi:Aspartokinase [Rhabdochlamydiaceae symbiont of Dictyostelium giganteum]